MVLVNFRINYRIKIPTINKVLKNAGYEYISESNTAIQVEDKYLNTEVFIRNSKNGRYHLFTAHGKKYSGSEEYPQLNIFLHYDIKKTIKGKERHIADRNEKRNMDEIYRIEAKFLLKKVGFLEIKDRMCAHTTIDLADKDKLLGILQTEFKKYDKWKFRKKYNSSQCTISLFEQENFIHIVCVYAELIGKDHKLNKPKSIHSLKNILTQVCNYQVKIV